MKKLILSLALAPLMAFAASSTPAGFTDNLDEAFTAAKASGKYVYACFSGSDWCGWCKRLDKEVFAKKEFLDAVTNDYVLVFIDSPADQKVLSERAKVENPKLTKKYEIKGFPTALVLTGDGEQVETTGYRAGGPKAYADFLLEIRKDGPARAKKEAAKKAYVDAFKQRQEKIMTDLRAEIMEAQKAPVAAAAVKIETLIKDFEAVSVPEGLQSVHDEFLDELGEIREMLKGEK